MFHFYSPWFALLLPLPLVVKLFFSATPKKNAPEIFLPGSQRLQRLKKAFPSHTGGSKTSYLFSGLLFLAWSLLVLALMQPEKIDQFKQVKNEGYDLMLAVDISGSMQALDFSTDTKKVSRLDVTKEVVNKFVLGRQGDRVGLIVFGEKAYLHVPLTLDTASVAKMLENSIPGMAGNATAIGDAIGLSVRTLRERPAGSRVLVLLTDGDDNSSSLSPLEAARLAKQYGIKIYTIGVGKKGLVLTGMGGYAMAEVNMNEELLKQVAEATGGKYFLATNKKALESIYSQINVLEKTEANETLFLIREPFYFYPLGLAMTLLLSLSLYQLFQRREAYGS